MPSIVEASLIAATGALTGATPFAVILGRTHRVLRTVRRILHEDDLTRLGNRRAFLADLDVARRQKRQVSVALLDVNQFKYINDTHGHQTGDEVLCALAERLRALPPPVRRCARLGGDEFVLLISGNLAAAARTARQVWQVIAGTPVIVSGKRLHVTVSIGVAAVASSGYARLLPDADRAMYAAKKSNQGVSVGPLAGLGKVRDRRRFWRRRDEVAMVASITGAPAA